VQDDILNVLVGIETASAGVVLVEDREIRGRASSAP
jgi:hypothetical protein